MSNLIHLHRITCYTCYDYGVIIDRFDQTKRTPCLCRAAQPPQEDKMSDETKRTSRLASYGQDASRWIASQIYTRMLTAHTEFIMKIKTVRFGEALTSDINIGEMIYREDEGAVYFNEDDGIIFILVNGSDEDELAAGQVGPMGDM